MSAERGTRCLQHQAQTALTSVSILRRGLLILAGSQRSLRRVVCSSKVEGMSHDSGTGDVTTDKDGLEQGCETKDGRSAAVTASTNKDMRCFGYKRRRIDVV